MLDYWETIIAVLILGVGMCFGSLLGEVMILLLGLR
jgi:hypothetical protein